MIFSRKHAWLAAGASLFAWMAIALEAKADTPAAKADGLKMRLVGTAAFHGEAMALVEIGSTGLQQFLALNDSLDGFIVSDITSDKVTFKKNGQEFNLAMQQANVPAIKGPVPTLYARDLKSGADEAPRQVASASVAPPPARKAPAAPAAPARERSSSAQPNFASPLNTGRYVSGYGYRTDPMGGGNKFHYGVDLAAPVNSPIHAAAGGVVVDAGYKSRLGRFVEIKHENGFNTIYGHMNKTVVKAGDKVEAGDVVGLEGSTGNSTGPHVHFEIHKNGQPVRPDLYVSFSALTKK